MISERESFYGHSSDGHERFKKLSALANSGTLSASEWFELEEHLRICHECRDIYCQYQLLATAGMPFLAAAHSLPQENEKWDDSPSRQQLRLRVREEQSAACPFEFSHLRQKVLHPHWLGSSTRQWIIGAVAASLFIAVSLASYHAGRAIHTNSRPSAPLIQKQVGALTAEKRSVNESLEEQAAKIARMEDRSTRLQQEVGQLQSALHAAEKHSAELVAGKSESEEQLLAVSRQRDNLRMQLQQAEQSYQSEQVELATLRSEHDRTLLKVATLESKIDDLAASNHELERRLTDDDQFLASDRDIRELMGARKLYIADVFDVDSRSRTRKPFGRVFYTQNKSLIFYAFDLDREPGVKNASIFQVWGQKDSELTGKQRATNLGILYMDSETNRRWVLRLDDPKQLAEIDAVFVTVEPHGGSPKPTGKPLLYALLRKEANHP